jgi:flavin-dependent dehydrogenase
MHETIVIGAGPVGSYYASKKECLVLEQKKRSGVGEPVQCTGLVSTNIDDFVKLPKSFVQNRIHGAVINSPSNQVYIKRKNVAYVINRKRFDQFLLDKALEKSEVVFDERVEKYSKFGDYVQIKTAKNVYRTRYLVDASGPKSDKPFLLGLQVRAELEREPFVELFFGEKVCPGFFAWIVPESKEVCRVGLATRSPSTYLDKFLEGLGNPKILDWQGGIIPMHEPSARGESWAYYLGDRGGHAKPTTGGGLVLGLKSAEILSRGFDGFERKWDKTVGGELKLHWRIRNFLNKLNDKELDELVKLVKQVKPELEKHGDMDYPSLFLRKLLNPPVAWYAVRNFFKML